ncbi:MAG: hypothetical protein MJH10_04615, partial [Epibacterium sp.]|nr:hypothetical protein [Epibacterium sp.]
RRNLIAVRIGQGCHAGDRSALVGFACKSNASRHPTKTVSFAPSCPPLNTSRHPLPMVDTIRHSITRSERGNRMDMDAHPSDTS